MRERRRLDTALAPSSASRSGAFNGQLVPRRGAVRGIAASATVAHYAAMRLAALFGDWRLAAVLVTYVLMAIVPFVLARAAPRAPGFDTRWFPPAWSHWLWFFGMVFLLFVCGVVAAILVHPLGMRPPSPTFDMPTKASVILAGAVIVLIGPIAEEVFWRGYFLEQLRKLTRPAAALLTQALFFGLAHLHGSQGCLASIGAFLLGVVLGMWRIRLRSLLPLMLAHMVFNGVLSIPMLREQYELAQLMEPVRDDVAEYFKNVRSNPKCRRIEALSREVVQEAVPGIIDYFADRDEHVRRYAAAVLVHRFRREAEPYLKAPLSSRDKNTVDSALSVVGFCGYSAYKQQVRDVVWSAGDLWVQTSGLLTLQDLKDEEGLRGIAQSHPKARVREIAERCLARVAE